MIMRIASVPTNPSVIGLQAPISTELDAMLKRAAEIQGCTVNDFVVSAVREVAEREIEKTELIRLSVADQKRFAQALISPPPPSAPLQRAVKRHNTLISNETIVMAND